jgi:hypothetical protein
MTVPPLIFRIHAIERMFQRGISKDDVRSVLEEGQVIEEYPEDQPCPSRLILGWRGTRPLHVVASDDSNTHETIIITVYEPDPAKWEAGFSRRRKA